VREYPYWLDTVPALRDSVRSAQSPIPNPESRYDVVIVGGGYTGLAAARHLARVGATVLILERESIGWGASSRNGGQLLTGLKLDAAALVRRCGERMARRLFDAAGDANARLEALIAEDSIDCEFERVGHVQAAAKPSHFDDFRRDQALLARVFEHRVELVSRADQRSEIGSGAYHGLLVDERSAALNPAKYVHGLAAAARRAGACIAAGVAAVRVDRAPDGWTIATGTGTIAARDVLFATNGYVDGASPALRRRFVPIGSFIIATAPLTERQAASVLPRRRVAFDSKHFLHYFRLSDDRRLLFGGRAQFSTPDAETTRQAGGILRRDLAGVFPELEGIAIDYAWGGNVAFTRDQLPHAGRLDGAYYAGGYCGHGIAMATCLGELIARRIAGEPIDHVLFDDRFPPIPLYSGRPWFLPMVGMWYRFLDAIR